MFRFSIIGALAALLILPAELLAQDADSLVAEGNIRYREGAFAAARDLYSGAIEVDPQNAAAFNNRALAQGRLAETEAALTDFARAIALAPANGDIQNNRANLFCQMGRYSESFRDRLQAAANGRFTAGEAQGSLRKQGFYQGLGDGLWNYETERALEDWTEAGCARPPADRLL